MDDPQADAISLTNLADRKRSGGQRRAGDAMLEPDPTYDVDREGLAGRACQPFAIEPSDDLFIIVSFRHRTNFSNKGIGITDCLDTVWLSTDIDRFGCSALPANLQVQQLGFCTLVDPRYHGRQGCRSRAVALANSLARRSNRNDRCPSTAKPCRGSPLSRHLCC